MYFHSLLIWAASLLLLAVFAAGPFRFPLNTDTLDEMEAKVFALFEYFIANNINSRYLNWRQLKMLQEMIEDEQDDISLQGIPSEELARVALQGTARWLWDQDPAKAGQGTSSNRCNRYPTCIDKAPHTCKAYKS